jgi:hypothetical protein
VECQNIWRGEGHAKSLCSLFWIVWIELTLFEFLCIEMWWYLGDLLQYWRMWNMVISHPSLRIVVLD